ncbi:hypothetical protein NUM3379_01000 [Kineococcus sp. NUM-3379]
MRQRTRLQAACESGAAVLWLLALLGGLAWVVASAVEGAVLPVAIAALSALASLLPARRPRHLQPAPAAPARQRLRPATAR